MPIVPKAQRSPQSAFPGHAERPARERADSFADQKPIASAAQYRSKHDPRGFSRVR